MQVSTRASAGTVGQNGYMWPLIVACASSLNGGWVPRTSILKADRSYITCYGTASKITQCHICHIWFVRSKSLSLVFIQDSWGISLLLLIGRVSKNRVKFQHHYNCLLPFPQSPGLFPNHQTFSFVTLHFSKWLQEARNLEVIFLGPYHMFFLL